MIPVGVHLIYSGALPALAHTGVSLPRPALGVIDLLRALEGRLPEPPARSPLVVGGLEALLRATPEPAPALQVIRAALVEARAWFSWRQVPLVFLVDIPPIGPAHALTLDGHPLVLLLGSRLQQRAEGWWASTQLS